MTDEKSNSRRTFLKKSATAAAGVSLGLGALSAPTIGPVLGANNKIRMGFIGLGNRGSQLLQRFMKNEDVEVVALCDAYNPYVQRDRSLVSKNIMQEVGGKVPQMGEEFGREVKRYADFRNLLDQNDIDAVCIATPDHWHALMTIMAIDAGKDVYVEKPLTATISEGRRMVEAQANSGKVVQVGLNRRGSSIYQELVKKVRSGLIGEVSIAIAGHVSNMFPDGIGNAQPASPPEGFDWDMWIGPREWRPFQYNIAPYKFRWWKSYSSQMGNWGVHYMDAIRWMLGERAPIAISANGSKKILHDDRTIPDTLEVSFEFESGAIINFAVYEACGGELVKGGEIELRGTKANLICDQNGYQITPTKGGQFQERGSLVSGEKKTLEGGTQFGDLNIREDSTANLIRNFLDCVKSREKPWCELEEGHRSTTFAHLANIAVEKEIRIEWDPDNEQILNHREANNLLHYKYRSPWDSI